jgi:hypothetical protein
MGKLARIILSALIIATLLGVVFFELTGIAITSGLASLFALIGLVASWAGASLFDALSQRVSRGRTTAPPKTSFSAPPPSSHADHAPATPDIQEHQP